MLESLAQTLRHGARPPMSMPVPMARSPFLPALPALPAAPSVPSAPSMPAAPGIPAMARAAAPGSAIEREPLSPLARCMAHMLDEIDYGMLLVDADARVLYLNHAARRELDQEHPLQLAGQQLVTAHTVDAGALQDALAEAQRGLRRLLTLGSGDHLVAISVVPLNEPGPQAGTTLLVLGKRRVCEQLTMHGYARAVALTPAETRVLEQLCDGAEPTAIASQQGVAVSTVRTQIGSIRAKTGTNSIRELVCQVAVLPPLVGALRNSTAAFGIPRNALAA